MSGQSTPQVTRVHPVHRFAAAALAALDRVADAPAWTMSPVQQAETSVELTRLQARVAELRLRVLVAADRSQVGDRDGSVSTAGWLSERTRETRAQVNADLQLAMALDDPGFATTREALAAGRSSEDQARVVVAAVEDLPDGEVSEAQRVAAQEHLVGLAQEFDPHRLRQLGRRLFEVIAPERADVREGTLLEAEERRARQSCRFAMRDEGDGTSNGWFTLPTLQAQMLAKAVQAFAAPRRSEPGARSGPHGGTLPYRVLLGQAFAEPVEHLPVDRLPQAGGTAAAVVVTVGLDALRAGLGAASLDSQDRVSASQVRRLACNSAIIPAVLGSGSAPLDLGRTVRLHTAQQRTALSIRDRGCTAQGCDRPPAWCEAHHEVAWADGGGTSVANGRLLCPRHHHLAHDPRFDMRRITPGRVSFHRRT